MPYEPLHHKYRPATFADLVGQEAIAQTLVNAIRQQKIAPAYLFTGSRGTGKTSSARIMAKSLNCLQSSQPTETPCGVCEACRSIANGVALDTIEIDAASNTGVDNIRELIERAQFAPMQCRYKIYLIDECHMLSTAAFNALLKTLEEPPDRVIFILATTDPQRVLPTIISRCQRFDFRRIPQEAMVQHLHKIADLEEIAIEQEAIVRVAQIAQGGLRDAESLLDQLSLNGEIITPQHVWDLVGAVPERDLLSLLQAILTDRADVLLELARQLMDRGREPPIVLHNLAGFYRDLLIAKTSPDRHDLVALTPQTWAELCQLARDLDLGSILAGGQHLRSCETQLRNTTQPRLWLEVALLGLLPSRLQFQPPTRTANPHPPPNPPPSHYPAQNSPAQNPPAQNAPAQNPQTNGSSIAGSTPENPPSSSPQTNGMTQVSSAAALTNGMSSAPAPTSTGMEASSDSQPETPSSPPDPNAQDMQLPPAAPTIQAGEQNLTTIWQQVLELIQMRATRELFRQQGQLVALDGSVAQIAVVPGLIAIATSKAKDLEAAFARAFDRTIRIKLEAIGNASQSAANPAVTSQPPVSSPVVSQPAVSQPAMSQPAMSQPIANPAPIATAPTPVAAPVPPTPVAEPSISPTVDSPTPQAPVSSGTWDEDEVLSAANRLADFFNGEVIAMEDEFEESGL
jgi:DNA polymerase-3 subunit gamma/tau